MLKIRLLRGGRKSKPYYSLVVANATSSREGRFLEKVGSYNPLLKKGDPNRILVHVERVIYWIGKGAQPTDIVLKFLINMGVTVPAKLLRKWDQKTSAWKIALEPKQQSSV